MRNLKKALALVLALMMALSLMSFASASDYPDDSAIEQDEAVSVMSALGVFNGTDGGVFDPEGTLTRAQAAKIITYMLLDKEVADSLPNTGSKFTDCPDGRWYVGAVNFLTDMGIVAGRSETTFDPNGKVNGYEFAKMLLGALGYDSKIEKFESDSGWALNIATTARRAGLSADLPVSAISSVYLTREQAAKLAFNTLTADMVYYQGGVSVGDVTVNPTRNTMANSTSNDYRTGTYGGTGGPDSNMQFCEQYFPELKYNKDYNTADDFGRTPDGQWVNGTAAAYTNLADPIAVFDSTVTPADMEKALKAAGAKSVAAKSTKNNTVAGANDLTSWSDVAGLTGNGRLVEVYMTSAGVVNSVVQITYQVETVNNITERNGNTTYAFSVSGNKVNNADTTNVVLKGTVAKDDVVTTVTLAGSKPMYVYPTTKFTGNQTAKKGNTVTIGGADYVVGTNVTGATAIGSYTNSKDEANYWADVNGYLVKAEGITTSHEISYAYIVSALAGTSGTASLDDPTPGITVNVRAVLSDGTAADYTLKTAKATAVKTNGSDGWTGDTLAVGDLICGNVKLDDSSFDKADTEAALTNKLFGYYIDDGKMVLDKVDFAADDATAADSTYGVNLADNYDGKTSHTGKDLSGTSGPDQDGITVLFNSKTVFVLYSVSNGKATVKAVTGTSGLSISGTDGGLAIVKTGTTATQGTASVVFLTDNTVAPVVDYVYIDTATETSVLHNDKDVYSYIGIAADGTEDTYYTSNDTALEKSGVYTYTADKVVSAGSAQVVEDTTAASGTPVAGNFLRIENAQTNDNLIYVGNTWVQMTPETQTVLAEGVEGVAGSNCYVVMKSAGEVATIFAYEAYEAPAPNIVFNAVTAPADLDMNGNGSGTEKLTDDVVITVTTPSSGTGVTIKSVSSSDSTKVAVAEKAGQSMPTVTLTAKAEATDITITVVLQCDGYSDTTVTFKVSVANS